MFRLTYKEAIDRQTKLYVQYFNYCPLCLYGLGSQQDSVKQARQCTYDVTMRPVRATIVAVEKQLVLHNLSMCVVCYPTCNAHGHIVIRVLSGSIILVHIVSHTALFYETKSS